MDSVLIIDDEKEIQDLDAVFEATRKRVGPNYWQEDEVSAQLREADFTGREIRRTFFDRASVLAWVRKDTNEEGGEKRTLAGSGSGRNSQSRHLWRRDLVLHGATRWSGEEMAK